MKTSLHLVIILRGIIPYLIFHMDDLIDRSSPLPVSLYFSKVARFNEHTHTTIHRATVVGI
jgi:hypothetical protein